jgi:hypothetical protein
MAAAVVLVVVTVSPLSLTRWSAEATGFIRRPDAADNSIPALQGAAAITYLKERKLYDSLRTALNAVRTRRGDYSVVTPLVIDEQKLTASDGARGHRFGFSVAISGSILVVGAEGDVLNDNTQDAAYIFERQAGSWVEKQRLSASDGLPTHGFGLSVAVSGSTILVGAPFDAITGNNQGSVSVFEREGQSWVETQKLTGSDDHPQQQFGRSIAISGSTIVIGAPFDGEVEQGAAYIFNHQGGSWTETQKLIASDGGQLEFFGTSVAVSGSTIASGSQRATVGGNIAQGAAYIFNRQGGSWTETQKLIASDGQANAIFGHSIALSGSTIVVGAPFDTISGNALQGSAYIFNRQGGTWSETQKLIASDGVEFNLFGLSLALSGSTIVVGAQTATINGNLAQGAAYIFNRQAGSWTEAQKLTASDGMLGDFFGQSVASSGSTIVVGAPFDTIGANRVEGSAYVFGP